ncbi:hypothetical protein GRI40_01320 [Altererythrobacter aerius]|uniref:Uncharacterized protein n=1 Tax=Tsuneonella aeria TaxID=1837929 RepID=A0A6I4TAT3_9SPHN|nr:hypothetical protein [Tsuneonella aeria]MXO73864.1 hypothetical protein [Tsuneonella aeria]
MSKPDQPEKTSPAQQKGEDHGNVKRPQQTDRNMRDVDLARGSEVETRNASSGR